MSRRAAKNGNLLFWVSIIGLLFFYAYYESSIQMSEEFRNKEQVVWDGFTKQFSETGNVTLFFE